MFSDSVVLGALAIMVAGFGLLVTAGVVLRPRWTLFAVMAGVLLFEQYPMSFPSHTVVPEFYNNLNITLGIGALKFNPLEIVFGLLMIALAADVLRHPRPRLQVQTVSILGAVYFGWMLVSSGWGIVNGGNWKVALWIARPVFYFLATAFMTYHLVRKPRHAMQALVLITVIVTIKSAQIIYRRFFIGIEPGSVEAYGSHECTSFALYAVWIAIAGFFLPYPKRLQWLLLLAFPVLLLGVVFNERRINIATLVVGTGLLFPLLSPFAIRRRFDWLALAAVIGAMYIGVGWFGPNTPVTAPVKGFKQGIQAELLGHQTDNSSWYRKVERYNLRHTVRANPIMGTGLGVPYLQLIALDKLSFEYAIYISHNQVLLVHSATGSAGYFIFLVFYGCLMAQLTIYWRGLREPWQRAMAVGALLSVINWLLVGYYDMQLFFFRNSMVVGFFAGLPAALYRMQMQENAAEIPADAAAGPDPIPPGGAPCPAV